VSRALRGALSVGLIAFLVYIWSLRTIVSVDSATNVLQAYSFVRDGDVWLDEFEPTASHISFWSYVIGPHRVSWYEPGAAYLATPIVALGEAAGIEPPAVESITIVGKVAAALMTAASVAVVYLMCAGICGHPRAVVVAALYAFGTSSWPTSAGGLWQHAPSQLLIALGLFASLHGQRWGSRAGLPYALAITVRAPNALFWLAGLGPLLRQPARALVYLGWSIAAAVLLVAYDLAAFGTPLDPYTVPPPRGNVVAGILGNLVAPSRGLLVFSPFLVLAIVGLVHAARRSGVRGTVVRWQIAAAFAALAVYGSYEEWWAGFTFGNRYLAETLPLLSVGLAVWLRLHRTRRATLALGILAAPAIVLNAIGAWLYDWQNWSWEQLPWPLGDLVWRIDVWQPWWTLTHAAPRLDLVTLFSLATAVLGAFLLFRLARTPRPIRGRTAQ